MWLLFHVAGFTLFFFFFNVRVRYLSKYIYREDCALRIKKVFARIVENIGRVRISRETINKNSSLQYLTDLNQSRLSLSSSVKESFRFIFLPFNRASYRKSIWCYNYLKAFRFCPDDFTKSSVPRHRERSDSGRGIKIHFQNEWSFIDNARSVQCAKEKPLNRAFRQTDRLRRAISVPPVGITLSLFTSMMLECSKKKEGETGGWKREMEYRNDESDDFVSPEKNSRPRKTDRGHRREIN